MNLKFLRGLKAGLANLAIVDGQVLFCTDTGEIFVDVGTERKEFADTNDLYNKIGTLPAGYENLVDFINTKVASVAAGDASVTIGGTATEPTVAVKVSADTDNALALAADGLKVVIPAQTDYTVTCADSEVEATEGVPAFKRHTLTQNGKTICTIDVPKDLVVQGGRVEGDKLILVLNDANNTEIEINVGDLIEYVTSGSADGDMVYVNIDENHKVTATITDGTITLAKLAQEVKDAIAEAKAKDGAGNVIVDTYAQKATTLEGYGITDAYTKNETAELDAAVLAEAQSYADAQVSDLVDGDIAAIKEALTWGTF